MDRILFADFETGGLPGRLVNGTLGMEYYGIFDIAIVVTDLNLHQVGEPLRIVVHQTEEVIARSSQWALDTHTKSGLLAEVRQSTITLAHAEQRILDYLKALGINKYDRFARTGAVLAGSSITFDRVFMMAQMDKLHNYLHYRQLDISSINLSCRAFSPGIGEAATSHKQFKHEAFADILESINELKFYRSTLFDLDEEL